MFLETKSKYQPRRINHWEVRSISIKQSYTCNHAVCFMEMTQVILLEDLAYYEPTSQFPLLIPNYTFKPFLIPLLILQTLGQVLMHF